ncbi:uncharacterized protein LOC114332967 [Diabrotica virgifera virgifera]|uniref:Uncharacterized protein LOC114332967 n=1 Tax=Diabrotica virgifera virgifera TaxID=50390 RepID=A0A6P7FQP7_DIAVI|nr:uncharacterized protein LOC114332967 [Diabrotica virgifera virgifera]
MAKLGANIFEVASNSNSIVNKQTSGLLPQQHKSFKVLNIGRTTIKAELLTGNRLCWHDSLQSPVEILPGDEKTLDVGNHLYYVTAVRICNDSPVRALVHVGKVDGTNWDQEAKGELKFDLSHIANILVKYGPGSIPVVDNKLETIIDFFWPQFESIWNLTIDGEYQIHEKTKTDIKQLRDRLLYFNVTLKYLNNSQTTPLHFMQLIDDMVGFEKKFIFNPEETNSEFFNYMFLPYYSSVISLKMCLYQFGILNRLKIGLLNEQVRRLLLLSKQLIESRSDGAIIYITRIYREIFNKQYANCDPQQIYEALAMVRTCCGVSGFQFFPYWNGILSNPYWQKKAYNDVVVYSSYYGRLSPNLAKQLVPEEVEEPLQPKLISSGKRNNMTRIDVFIWRKNYKTSPKIGGMSIYFQEGEVHNLGQRSQEVRTIDFKEFALVKLVAWGDNCIDCLEFIFSDERKEMCGSKDSLEGKHFVFELDYHYIAGIYLANDVPILKGQAANIAVSFQLNS